jgi:cell division protein FtsQ
MADLGSVSRQQLVKRRQVLKRQRRLHLGQSFWRLLALAGLTGLTLWAISRPIWVVRSPRQIQVRGNQLLSNTLLQDLVPLNYPKSLLEVQPEVIAEQLRQRAPLLVVEVDRQLLPPGLKVTVQERVPVAVVLPDQPGEGKPAGLIDAQGAWMPLTSFGLAPTAKQLPGLQVRGLQPQFQRYWPQVYATIHHSPVAVQSIDWSDPSNLVLATDLGKVHLGPYSPELEQQLATLDKMRNLPNHMQSSEVAYIDLSKPSQPAITLNKASVPESDLGENSQE